MAHFDTLKILKKGVAEWNKWRGKHLGFNPDFSDADLRSADLRDADLSYANFISADLSCASLIGADLTRAIFNCANLSGADLRSANLIGADLNSSDFSDANLTNVNFVGADLRRVDLRRANLSNSDLDRVDLSRADLRGTTLSSASLIGADLTHTILNGADLIGADLRDANLSNAILCDADLSNAIFNDAHLRFVTANQSKLTNSILSNVNLRNSTLIKAKLQQSNLLYANLSSSILIKASLKQSDLRGANLKGADWRGVNLTDADLRHADLTDANLEDAKLIRTKLGGANLTRTNLLDAKLNGAFLSEANLLYAQLDGADFSDSDLTNANLTRTQAIGTKFKGAIFTGACIEDWNINSRTNLEQIICEYVHQKNSQLERRPSSSNFQPGDFTRLYQRAIDTLDLIFQDGIDWKSFAVTLQELNTDRKLNVEDDNSQLTVRAIEKRDDGSFVIRVDVPISIDKAEIELEFKKKYTKQLKAQEEQYHQLLQAKDIDIEYHRQQNTSLTNIIATLASREITVNNNLEITTMTSSESKGDTYNQSNMGIGHVSGGDFKDNKIAGTINEAANPSLADAAAEIRDLLTELEKSYPANTTTEKMVIATKAIERIEADPAWQQRTVNALKLGSVAAFEKAIDNPIGAFLKGAFEGWENAK
jgi:uncharacterized protein YjbI with pentapeptide repeats